MAPIPTPSREQKMADLLRRLTDSITWPRFMSSEDECVVSEDVAREAVAFLDEHYPKPKTWRDDPPTEKQVYALRRFRDDREPKNKGEASDWLDEHIAGAKRAKIERQWSDVQEHPDDDDWMIPWND